MAQAVHAVQEHLARSGFVSRQCRGSGPGCKELFRRAQNARSQFQDRAGWLQVYAFEQRFQSRIPEGAALKA